MTATNSGTRVSMKWDLKKGKLRQILCGFWDSDENRCYRQCERKGGNGKEVISYSGLVRYLDVLDPGRSVDMTNRFLHVFALDKNEVFFVDKNGETSPFP